MKTTVTATLFILAILLASCEPAATFNEAQPVDVKSLPAFPARLQGNYLADDQSAILSIQQKCIVKTYRFDIKSHKDSLGAGWQVSGDTLINLSSGSKEPIAIAGDSIIQHINETDTLFNLAASDDLKKYKGYYFLNTRYKENAWVVRKLSIQKGRLVIGSIADKADVQKLKAITETTEDTVGTHFSLTRAQFKSFIKQDGFANQESFTRMAEELK